MEKINYGLTWVMTPVIAVASIASSFKDKASLDSNAMGKSEIPRPVSTQSLVVTVTTGTNNIFLLAKS